MSNSLEQLRSEWSDHSRRLDERLRASTLVLREDWIERQRERIWKLGPLGTLSLAAYVATLALLNGFLATHADQPTLFVSALIIDLWVIATGIAQLRQKQALRELDFGMPLVELQAKIGLVRISRIRSFNIALLTGQIVWWIPFIVVIAGAFGADPYQWPEFQTYAAWNVAVGIALIPLLIWLSRRYGGRLSRTSLVRHIADSIAGRDIAAAQDYLEKLRRFGDDP